MESRRTQGGQARHPEFLFRADSPRLVWAGRPSTVTSPTAVSPVPWGKLVSHFYITLPAPASRPPLPKKCFFRRPPSPRPFAGCHCTAQHHSSAASRPPFACRVERNSQQKFLLTHTSRTTYTSKPTRVYTAACPFSSATRFPRAETRAKRDVPGSPTCDGRRSIVTHLTRTYSSRLRAGHCAQLRNPKGSTTIFCRKSRPD